MAFVPREAGYLTGVIAGLLEWIYGGILWALVAASVAFGVFIVLQLFRTHSRHQGR